MSRTQQIGVGIALVLALIIALVLSRGSCDSQERKSGEELTGPGVWQSLPEPWQGTPEMEAHLELDSRRGPILRIDEETSFELTPTLGEIVQAWTYKVDDTRIRGVGTGEFKGARVESQWDFSQGNPQAHFSMSIEGAQASAYPGGIRSVLELPPGEITHVDDTLRVQTLDSDSKVSGWTPGWIRWTHQDAAVTFSGWWADGTRYERPDGEQSSARLEFLWVDPRVHRAYASCDDSTYSVSTRMMVSVGDLPIVLPSRFSDGAKAIVAPTFVSTDSIGRDFEDIERVDADGWEARVRALTLGHSSPDDPRHGNGGLLGAHLGGTFIWTGEHADRLKELSERLSDTSVEVDAGGGPVLAESWCDEGRTWLRPVEQYQSGYRNGVLPGYGVGLSRLDAVTLEVAFLEGERQILLEQAFSTLYLERLKRDRGLFAFVAPLVATRNPLNNAFGQALLVPERHGEWTLSPEVVRTFTELEMWRELNPEVRFAPVSTSVAYWQNARRCEIAFQESGDVRVRCPRKVDGFTLITEGIHEADSTGWQEGDADRTWTIRHADEQTWFWTSAGLDDAILGFNEDVPRAVRWVTRTQP